MICLLGYFLGKSYLIQNSSRQVGRYPIKVRLHACKFYLTLFTGPPINMYPTNWRLLKNDTKLGPYPPPKRVNPYFYSFSQFVENFLMFS